MQTKEEKRIVGDVESLIDGDRIIGFSDAVFAFAATLLVLKIDLPYIPPELLETHFTAELFKLWPAYAANLISFLIIAYYWRVHHKLFILIKRFDNIIIWLNVLTLISVSFLPFPIDLFGDYSSFPPVVIFYTASITLVGFLLLAMWVYASHRHKLIGRGMKQDIIDYHTYNLSIAPLVFLFSIPLVYYNHNIAKLSWILVVVFIFILNRLYAQKLSRSHELSAEPE